MVHMTRTVLVVCQHFTQATVLLSKFACDVIIANDVENMNDSDFDAAQWWYQDKRNFVIK